MQSKLHAVHSTHVTLWWCATEQIVLKQDVHGGIEQTLSYNCRRFIKCIKISNLSAWPLQDLARPWGDIRSNPVSMLHRARVSGWQSYFPSLLLFALYLTPTVMKSQPLMVRQLQNICPLTFCAAVSMANYCVINLPHSKLRTEDRLLHRFLRPIWALNAAVIKQTAVCLELKPELGECTNPKEIDHDLSRLIHH